MHRDRRSNPFIHAQLLTLVMLFLPSFFFASAFWLYFHCQHGRCTFARFSCNSLSPTQSKASCFCCPMCVHFALKPPICTPHFTTAPALLLRSSHRILPVQTAKRQSNLLLKVHVYQITAQQTLRSLHCCLTPRDQIQHNQVGLHSHQLCRLRYPPARKLLSSLSPEAQCFLCRH